MEKILEQRLSEKRNCIFEIISITRDNGKSNGCQNCNFILYDFYDAIHRFRYMIFDDFYEQLNFF